MLTQDEIRQKALEHLEAKPFPDPDYCRVLKDGRELDDYWYFDYSFENLLGLPGRQTLLFVSWRSRDSICRSHAGCAGRTMVSMRERGGWCVARTV